MENDGEPRIRHSLIEAGSELFKGGSGMERLLRMACFCSLLGGASLQADQGSPLTILFDGKATVIPGARIEGDDLLVPVEMLKMANGFEAKPMGLCSTERCIPIPKGEHWFETRDGKNFVNVSRVAQRIGQPMVTDKARGLWAVGFADADRSAALELGQAPDFALPNREGKWFGFQTFAGRKSFCSLGHHGAAAVSIWSVGKKCMKSFLRRTSN